jgi:hypothetical protein
VNRGQDSTRPPCDVNKAQFSTSVYILITSSSGAVKCEGNIIRISCWSVIVDSRNWPLDDAMDRIDATNKFSDPDRPIMLANCWQFSSIFYIADEFHVIFLVPPELNPDLPFV